MTSPRVTIRTYKDNGPYFVPTIMQYSASCLRDILFHCRLAMEDGEDTIAIFHDNQCVGLWRNEPDIISDGEGSMVRGEDCYVAYKPGGPSAGWFNTLTKSFQK